MEKPLSKLPYEREFYDILIQTCHFFSCVYFAVLKINQFSREFKKSYLLCQMDNIRHLTRDNSMVLIKDVSKDFNNPHVRDMRVRSA